MAIVADIKNAIQEGDSLEQVSAFYSEIASVHLKQIRSSIEKNRAFLDEIAQILQIVQLIAAKKNIQLVGKKKTTLSILVTSNNRFFGDIDSRLCHYFIASTAKLKTERLVIGRFGKDFLKSIDYFDKFESVIFAKDIPQPQVLKKVIDRLSEYNQILVFYPELKSVFIQKPQMVDITRSAEVSATNPQKSSIDFIFEPEIPLMLNFFNTSIVGLLFEQTLLESELARTAARLTSMDKAQTNAETFIKNQRQILAQSNRSIRNARLLNTVSAILSLEHAKN